MYKNMTRTKGSALEKAETIDDRSWMHEGLCHKPTKHVMIFQLFGSAFIKSFAVV